MSCLVGLVWSGLVAERGDSGWREMLLLLGYLSAEHATFSNVSMAAMHARGKKKKKC